MATGGQAAGRFGIVGTVVLQGAQQVQSQLLGIRQLVRNTGQEFQTTQRFAQNFSSGLSNLTKRPASNLIFLGLDLQQLAQSMAILSGAFAIAGAAGTKFAIDFQSQLRGINALAQLSERDLAALGEQIRGLTFDPSIVQGPRELATGLRFIISSGFEGAEALGVLRQAARGATAGNAELASVSKALVGVLNALPRGAISAADVIDILAETVDKGIIEFEDLSNQLGEVLGAVGATQVPFTEVGAAISVITRAGIPAAETMTALNRVLLSFIAPTAEAKELAAELGLEFNVTSLRSKGLVESLREVDQAVGDDTEALKTLFGDTRAVRGALALTRNDLADFTELAEQQTLATQGLGAAQKQLAEQLKSPSVQIKALVSDLENVGITIGNDILPVLLFFVRGARELAQGFKELPPVFRTVTELFGLTAIGLTGLTFAAARTITGMGALKNFVVQAFGSVTAFSGAVVANSVALNANAGAAGRAAGAQYALALAQGRASGAMLTNTGLLAANQVATKNAAGGFFTLAARIGSLALVGGVIFEVTQLVKGLTTELVTSGKTARELFGIASQVEFLQNLPRSPFSVAPALNLALPSPADIRKQVAEPTIEAKLAIEQATAAQKEFTTEGIEGIGKLEQQLRQLIKVSNDPQLIANASQALAELNERGVQAATNTGFSALDKPQKAAVRNFISQLDQAIIEAERTQPPEIVAQLKLKKEQVLNEIGGLEERTPITLDVVLKPRLEELQGQLDAVKLDEERKLADSQRKLDAIESAQTANRIRQLEVSQQLKNATRDLEGALEGLEEQQRANRLAQAELNVVMKQAQRELRAAQDAVNALQNQLSDAQDRIEKFSNPSLVGMRALENAIFGVSQKIAQLNLQLLDVSLPFIEQSFSLDEEVLKARLALLELGDEAEKVGDEAKDMAASFSIQDLIDAQQRELREGVPVLRTIWEKINDSAKSDLDSEDTVDPEREAAEKRLRDAERLAEINRIQQQLAEIQIRKELELAGIEQRRLELTKETTFEPQLRELRLMADQTKEITFEEAVQELQQAIADQNRFNAELLVANQTLNERESAMETLQEQQEALQAEADKLRLEEEKINAVIDARKQLFQDILDALQDEATGMQIEQLKIQQGQEAIKRAAEESLIPIQKQKDLLEEAASLRFSPPQNQGEDLEITNQIIDNINKASGEIATAQDTAVANILKSLGTFAPAVDLAIGAIGGATSKFSSFFLELFGKTAAVHHGGGGGGILSGEGEEFAFHQGGPVAPALPRGTEVPALLQAGEHVLTQRQASQVKQLGVSLTPFKMPKFITPKFHEGGEVPSPTREISRQMSQIRTERVVFDHRLIQKFHEGGEVQQIGSGGGTPVQVTTQPSQTWNWNVTMNNVGNRSDTLGRLSREVRMRRIAGRWR